MRVTRASAAMEYATNLGRKPAFFFTRHSRESGNPDDCSQARHPKSGMNSSQRIPSPFMGL